MFSYVDIESRSCEGKGWINLFFDGKIIALITDPVTSQKIKDLVDASKASPTVTN